MEWVDGDGEGSINVQTRYSATAHAEGFGMSERWGVTSLAFSPDGKTFVSTGHPMSEGEFAGTIMSNDGLVRLWNAETLELIASLDARFGPPQNRNEGIGKGDSYEGSNAFAAIR